MKKTMLGRTGLLVGKTAFGCLPIQRVTMEEAGAILLRAHQGGIDLFDTARAYTDSEQKIGETLSSVRDELILASKTTAKTADKLWDDLHASLAALKTGWIDIYQFHNPSFVPRPGGKDGLYDAMLEAKRQGLIRFIGISQHSLKLAEEAVHSGLYDTLQFPFNHLASDSEIDLVRLCQRENVGFICMKALSGGLITDAAVSFSFLRPFSGVVPIWGFQRTAELEQLLSLEQNPPAMDEAMRTRIGADRASLSGSFCRGCGYCLPCPAGIPIHNANRMTHLVQRAPSENWITPEWQAEMAKIEKCTRCGQCEKRCPYGLKPYDTLPEHLMFYRAYYKLP